MVMRYEDQKGNVDLNSFLRSTPASDEELVEGIIMDSDGVTVDDIKHRAEQKGRKLKKSDIENLIFTINRKYIDEIDREKIVLHNGRWTWRDV